MCQDIVSACAMCAEFEADARRQANEYQQQVVQQARPYSTDGLLDWAGGAGGATSGGWLVYR